MELGISGRKALVCASSKGLGKACAAALAEAGCELFVNGRDEPALRRTADDIRGKTGVKVVEIVADLMTEAGRAAVIEACPDPDILVNNNSGPPSRDFRSLDHAALLAGVEANMLVPITLIQAYVDGMVTRRFGRIVNITSGSVKAPLPGLDLSSGARAGLTGFVAGVAREVAHANVTINHLLPGAFATDRQKAIAQNRAAKTGATVEEVWAQREASIPARRYGVADEFGQCCAFLASVHAGYITGQSLLIDGGAYPGIL